MKILQNLIPKLVDTKPQQSVDACPRDRRLLFDCVNRSISFEANNELTRTAATNGTQQVGNIIKQYTTTSVTRHNIPMKQQRTRKHKQLFQAIFAQEC